MIANSAEIIDALGLSGSATDADLALVCSLQPRVERSIEAYLGFMVETFTREELLPAMAQPEIDHDMTSWDVQGGRVVEFTGGLRILRVNYTPLRSIISIYEDRGAFGGQAPNDFAPETLLTQGEHFYVDVDETGICRSGEIIRIGSWPGMPRTVKVKYVSGYTRDELDGKPTASINVSHIPLAVIEQMTYEYNWRKRNQPQAYREGGPVTEERLADWMVRYASNDDASMGRIGLTRRVKELLEPELNYSYRL